MHSTQSQYLNNQFLLFSGFFLGKLFDHDTRPQFASFLLATGIFRLVILLYKTPLWKKFKLGFIGILMVEAFQFLSNIN